LLQKFFFQETLEYTHIITLCYSHQSLRLQAQIPFGPMWVIVWAVTSIPNQVVQQCVLNQTRGY
jgi:hypothetical protein